jgi:hypothetical protein
LAKALRRSAAPNYWRRSAPEMISGCSPDAGCPGIADPGALLVAAAHREGIAVAPLVGPSAILLALMASGMNGQGFAFHGYLPAKPPARVEAIRRLESASRQNDYAQLFIETPYRNASLARCTCCHLPRRYAAVRCRGSDDGDRVSGVAIRSRLAGEGFRALREAAGDVRAAGFEAKVSRGR